MATVEGLAHAFVSGVLVMPLSQTLLFIFAGIALSPVTEPEPQKPTSITPWDWLSKVALLALLITYIVLMYQSYQWQDSECLVNIGPRFWIEGGRIPCE